jgi:hypothetical protein
MDYITTYPNVTMLESVSHLVLLPLFTEDATLYVRNSKMGAIFYLLPNRYSNGYCTLNHHRKAKNFSQQITLKIRAEWSTARLNCITM